MNNDYFTDIGAYIPSEKRQKEKRIKNYKL